MATILPYIITGMRVLPPSAKTRASNPDLAFTVAGSAFHQAKPNAKGDGFVVGDALSIQSKPVTIEQTQSPDFRLDLANGLLVLPEGRRGRTASEGMSQDEVDAYLAELREAVSSPDDSTDNS